MKLSDIVVKFIEDQGVTHVFGVTGGAIVHVFDSISKSNYVKYVCNNHEQASAMAADAYSRASGNIGVVIATSGPGATNLLTGVAGAYYDSIPLLCITGQVTTFRLRGNSGVRQVGFQETDTVGIFKPVTKYATMVRKPEDILYELEKAVYISKTGRPGPVLVDIPDDLQRTEVDITKLRRFTPPDDMYYETDIYNCVSLLMMAKKPVVILGHGVQISKSEKDTKNFVERLGFPVLQTWAVPSILSYTHPLHAGYFGQHGSKYGNLTVQNADLLLVLGCRLDTHMVGSKPNNFSPNSVKILVDIDNNEILRLPHTIGINNSISNFIDAMNKVSFTTQDTHPWLNQINEWKKQYPIIQPSYYLDEDVNPYIFFLFLSECVRSNDTLVADTGSALAWFMQSFLFRNQKLYSDFNNTSMGWALPASIGSYYATGKRIIAIMGDGALQMNIQELSTIALRKIPAKIFVIDNRGYSMMRQTQDDWLKSNYQASTYTDIGCADYAKVAEAYGIRSLTISSKSNIEEGILNALNGDDPVLCNVKISDKYRICQVVKFGENLA